ncbi:MAG: hypothetical protein GX677_03075 [Treponema sp.]|jgi:uncharacterized protein YqfA (UPF0365 family)|nr:hypothetical protein [Treponema sp.]
MIDEEIDEKVREQRKKDAIEYQNKKRNSYIFMLCASLFEIVETVLLIVVLFVVFMFFMIKVFHIQGDAATILFQVMTVVIFIGGMILGFIIYRKVVQWAIEKFNIAEKINDNVLVHYKKQPKEDKEAKLRK